MDDHEKTGLIALGVCGYLIDGDTNTDDVEIFYCQSLKDLASQFVEEGFYGDIPESIRYYIDYDAIARDLRVEYAEMRVGQQNIVYRCP